MALFMTGFSGSGLRDWYFQRLSAVVMTVYAGVLAWFFFKHGMPTYFEWLLFMTSSWMRVLTAPRSFEFMRACVDWRMDYSYRLHKVFVPAYGVAKRLNLGVLRLLCLGTMDHWERTLDHGDSKTRIRCGDCLGQAALACAPLCI